MRRIISLLLILTAITVNARQVSPEEAQTIASEFFGNTNSPKHVGFKGIKRVAPKDADTDYQPYYVFNAADNAGFVIISGDTRSRKILGYSDKGKFDYNNLPPQLSALLEQYETKLNSLTMDESSDPSWGTSSVTTTEGVLLETANWGQGAPYNAQCPNIDGQQALTGCVATAMSIVMRYNNWPDTYDWESMPIENETTDNSSEIARLMSEAGKSVLMNYGVTESGANMNWVGHKLQQDFKYSPYCQYITKQNFNDDTWANMLHANLDAGQPIIYNGVDHTKWVGHAFVIDGYNNSGYHVNWGWDGLYNGYYDLTALNPGDNNFSSESGMVINIVPDKSGKEYSKCFVDYGYFWATGGMASGSHFSIDSPQQNQVFDYTCLVISYPCNESGEIGLLLYNKEGKAKEVLKSNVFTESRDDFGLGLSGSHIWFPDITISSEVMPDDYITLATRKSLSHPWLELLGTIEAPVKSTIASITKDVGQIKIINNVPGSKLIYYKNPNWIDLASDENTLEWVKGGKFSLHVLDEYGITCSNVIITVAGTGIYGDTNQSYDGSTSFDVYGDSYTITIEKTDAEIEKTLNLTHAGTLQKELGDTPLLQISSLTISGFINAEDLWFIRDNIKSLTTLDISETTITACEAIDPVEAFRMGSEHLSDMFPTYALTGLTKLSTLKLPKSLKYIESNSMMNLAIERIEIPSTVQNIGVNVFFDCINLNTIVAKMPQPPIINECIFTNTKCPSEGLLYVPTGSIKAYRSAAVWQDFAQMIEDDNPPKDTDVITFEGLKYRIHGKALYLIGYNQSQLPMDVIIPDAISVNGYECNVLGIDENAMRDSQINSFTMSNSIITISSDLFSGSTVSEVHMSDNIKYLPFHCIDGEYIEKLNIPENAELICNSIYCPSLKKLHLPKKLKSEIGYSGSIGRDFRNLEEITVDPENEEWSVHDGILYWKGLSNMILIPNTKTGEIVIPNETTQVNSIEHCNNISKITFGSGIKSLNYATISNCNSLKHIDFNNDLLLSSNGIINNLPCLESFTIRDFISPNSSTYGTFCYLPSLKYVYLLNNNPVDFSGSFYEDVNPEHDYFSESLNPQAVAPENCTIFVPGGVDSGEGYEEMWSYVIDRTKQLMQIQPLIEGLVIDEIIINGVTTKPLVDNFYELPQSETLDVVVNYTLHNRQAMSTHYTPEFNASLADSDLTLPIKVSSIAITPSRVEDFVGSEHKLTATVLPENATNKEILWSSDNAEVAEVDANGVLRLLAPGTTTITASATDGSGVQAQCTVIVINKASGVDNVLIEANTDVKIYSTAGILLFEGKYTDAKLDEGIYIIVTHDSRFKQLIK